MFALARSGHFGWAVGPLSDTSAWNRALQRLNPLWSLNEIRARVVQRVDEDARTLSLWLKPNRHWPGHQAGQHITLGVEIDGVLRHRVFSLSEARRGDGLIRVTLQRQGDGGVTDWLHRHAQAGLVVRLSEPAGEFVLPAPVPSSLLLLGAGSGITPLIAMLHQLAAAKYAGSVVLVQLCRHSATRLFESELSQLQQRLPGLQLRLHSSAEQGRLSPEQLHRWVPDLNDRRAYMCGPSSWMEAVGAYFEQIGLDGQLHQERFSAPRPVTLNGQDASVNATESKQMFTQKNNASLLESAEQAGLRPNYGCRAGLCRTCLCKKQSGKVRNVLTGLSSDEPGEWIQLCVSVAETDLELEL